MDHTSRRLEVKVKKAINIHYDEVWETYPMGSLPRGIAVIINYKNFPDRKYNRQGSHVDVVNLTDLCRQLDFDVKTYEDLSAEATLKALDSVVKNPLLQLADMLMVFIMSHAVQDQIICSDAQRLDTEEILSKLACIELKDKPKFIVFHTGRVPKDMRTFYNKIENMTIFSNKIKNPATDPIWEDMLIVYSTITCQSHIDSMDGSLFVESFVRIFMKYAYEKELKYLLRVVQTAMDGYKQSIEVSIRGFNKSLYFNPGIYVTDNSIRMLHEGEENKLDRGGNELEKIENKLDRGGYELEKIETGYQVMCLHYNDVKIAASISLFLIILTSNILPLSSSHPELICLEY